MHDQQPKKIHLLETNTFTRIYRDGRAERGEDRMLTEHTVEIFVNAYYAGKVPCTPQYIKELVIGWVNSEGFAASPADISSVDMDADAARAYVTVRYSGTDSSTGNDERSTGTQSEPDARSISAMPWSMTAEMKPVRPVNWEPEWIYRLAEDFEIQLPLREQTMAAHNCRLAKPDKNRQIEILFRCEDIGRHSAIDKAIGWGIENNIDLRKCVIFTSGRVSRAMAVKAVRAGVPILAGKGTISKSAVDLAVSKNLTLIGYSGSESLCVFTAPMLQL